MRDSLAIALAHLMSIDSAETTAPIGQSTPKEAKGSKPTKLKAAKATKAVEGKQQESDEDIQVSPPRPVPNPATPSALDATAFFLSSTRRNPSFTSREAEAGAIQAMLQTAVLNEQAIKDGAPINYAKDLPHGTQLDLARFAAKRALNPIKAHSENFRSAHASVRGFIAGMPDSMQKTIANLEARERAAVDTICNFVAQESVTVPGSQERAMVEGRITIEQARLNQIRKDLDNLR